jgi:hypothetical protein
MITSNISSSENSNKVLLARVNMRPPGIITTALTVLTALILAGSGCKGEKDTTASKTPNAQTSSALFELDITKGERLVKVHRANKDTPHSQRLYQIASEGQQFFWCLGQRSATFNTLQHIVFPGRSSDSYWVLVSGEQGKRVIAFQGGQFIESKPYIKLSLGVEYGGPSAKTAFLAGERDGERVLIFDGTRFQEGPQGKSLSQLEPTPDGRQIQYRLSKNKRWQYGIGLQLFQKCGKWIRFGTKGNHAISCSNESGAGVYINHEQAKTFDEIQSLRVGPQEKRLYYMAKRAKDWFVISESREEGEAKNSSAGAFTSLESQSWLRIQFHPKTHEPYFRAWRDKLVHLVMGNGKNEFMTSEGFDSVQIQRLKLNTEPVSVVKKGESTHVLTGLKLGPAFESLSRLSAANHGQRVVYFGHQEDRVRVVFGERADPSFARIDRFLLSQENEYPSYVGTSSTGVARVVQNGKLSKEYDRVDELITTQGDQIAYAAQKQGRAFVAIDRVHGQMFERVSQIRRTSDFRVWYDAHDGDKKYRVLGTKVSPAFSALGPAMFTDQSGLLLYVARYAFTKTSSSGEGENQASIDTVITRDYLMKNNEAFQSYQRDAIKDSESSRFLGAGSYRFPSVYLIRGSDDFYFQATDLRGEYAGFGGQAYGPFDEIKNLRLRPSKSGVVFFAKQKEKWAIQDGKKRGQELDEVWSLGFGPDQQTVRYEAKLADVRHSFMGDQRYLEVKNVQMNRNRDRMAYLGRRQQGWQAVLDFEHSPVFEQLESIRFSPEGYGLWTIGSKDGGKHLLRRPHGKPFQMLGLFKAIGRVRHYHLPFHSGFLKMNEGRFSLYPSLDSTDPVPLNLPKDKAVFVSLGPNAESIYQAWLIKAVDGDSFTLLSPPEEAQLLRGQGRGRRAFISPAHVPFSYSAKRDTNWGTVYDEKFYRKFGRVQFTKYRTLIAIASNEKIQLILGKKVSKGYDKIDKIIESPASTGENLFAFSVENEGLHSWVISRGALKREELGFVSRLNQRKKSRYWTPPAQASENAFFWAGTDGGRTFEAVNTQRYDAVRNLTVTNNTKALSYIGQINDRELLFDKQTRGSWYSKIEQLSFQGAQDTPVYIGNHRYLSKGDPALLRKTGQLKQIVVGDKKSNFYDDIHHLFPAASFDETDFTAELAGQTTIMRGANPLSASYEQIDCLVVEENTSGEHIEKDYHFLGRTPSAWIEVQGGDELYKIGSLRPISKASMGQDDLTAVSCESLGAANESFVLHDAESKRFIYRGLHAGQEMLVRGGQALPFCDLIGKIWSFDEGRKLAFECQIEGKNHIATNDWVSEPFKACILLPILNRPKEAMILENKDSL